MVFAVKFKAHEAVGFLSSTVWEDRRGPRFRAHGLDASPPWLWRPWADGADGMPGVWQRPQRPLGYAGGFPKLLEVSMSGISMSAKLAKLVYTRVDGGI